MMPRVTDWEIVDWALFVLGFGVGAAVFHALQALLRRRDSAGVPGPPKASPHPIVVGGRVVGTITPRPVAVETTFEDDGTETHRIVLSGFVITEDEHTQENGGLPRVPGARRSASKDDSVVAPFPWWLRVVHRLTRPFCFEHDLIPPRIDRDLGEARGETIKLGRCRVCGTGAWVDRGRYLGRAMTDLEYRDTVRSVDRAEEMDDPGRWGEFIRGETR